MTFGVQELQDRVARAKDRKDEMIKIRKEIVDFHGEMVLLENYSALNYTGKNLGPFSSITSFVHFFFCILYSLLGLNKRFICFFKCSVYYLLSY